jgi:hypothetical protein
MLARPERAHVDLLDHWHADLRGRDPSESVAQRLSVWRCTRRPSRSSSAAPTGFDLAGLALT